MVKPGILSKVKQYLKYLKDISTPYGGKLPDRPLNMSSAGTKTYRLDRPL